MSVFHYIIVCLVMVLNQSEAARVLAVFPVASISHQVVFRPLTQELARRGHEVTVITTDPAFPKGKTPANLTEIDVHDISYAIWKDTFMLISKGRKQDQLPNVRGYMESMRLMFDAQLKDEQVKKLIGDKTKQFDLILLESGVRPALIFSHIYKAPVILISSYGAAFDNFEVIGAPVHPLLYPDLFRQKLSNLSLWDKITELYLYYNLLKTGWDSYKLGNNLLRSHFGPDIPTIQELNNNVDMLFLNTHQVFQGIRPVPPGVLFMGGLHQIPEKELPKELKSYLDSSKHGVIYLSFGTNVDPSLLPSKTIETLVKAFSKLPYDVLWKWNKDKLPGRTNNIRISKWLPQSDLLRHPNIKLFITQGGLQSTDEAITGGVPLLGIPMLGDQWYNVQRYESHKIGLGLDMETMTEEQIIDAINTIINDDRYRKNIVRLRSVIHDQPEPPLERAMWWMEHVLRHGGAKHLRAPAANMSWTEYLELELVLTLLLGLLIVVTVLILIVRLIYKNIVENQVTIKVKSS